MQYCKKYITITILFLSVCLNAQTNDVFHKVFTKQDGLKIDNVKTMCFDNEGFLWLTGVNLDNREIIAKDNKLLLQRFNGQSFHNIYFPKQESKYINAVQIYKRKDGLFYIETILENEKILWLFNPKTMVFKKVKLNNFKAFHFSKIVNYNRKDYFLIQDKKIVSLCTIDLDLKINTIFTYSQSGRKYVIDEFSQIIPFKNFCIISAPNFTLSVFNWSGDKLKTYDYSYFFKKQKDKKVWIADTFLKDKKTYLFINDVNQLYYFNKKSLDIINVKNQDLSLVKNKPNNFIQSYSDSFNNNLIFTSNNNKNKFAVFLDQKFKEKLETIALKSTNKIQILSNNLKDHVWFATDANELHYIKFKPNKFKTYLNDYSIRAIKKYDENEFLIATEINGWFLLNVVSDKMITYKLDNKISYSSRNIFINKNVIWSNNDADIIKFNKRSNELKSFRHYPVNSLEKLNDSILIYGTKEYNLMQFNTKNKKHTKLLKTDSLNIIDIAIYKNTIYGATNKGFLSYNYATHKSKFYTNKLNIKDKFLLCLDFFKEDILIGSRQGKIIRFNQENKTFTTIYSDKLNAGIASILSLNDTLWINTFDGYVSYNIKNKITKRYGVKDGFSHKEANRYSALKTKDGLLVGTLKGLNYFKPDKLKIEKDNSELKLLKLHYYCKKQKRFITLFNRNELDNFKTIFLPPENRSLELDFSLTNLNIVKDFFYRYRLNNMNWNNLNKKNTIQFTNLSAGNYTLEIEAIDFSGNKIDKTLTLQINARNFFYKTWWFALIGVLCIILISLYIFYLVDKRHKIEKEYSKKLINTQEVERSRVAKELHDSIGQKLLILKNTLFLNKKHKPTEINLLDQTIKEVREMSHNLHPFQFEKIGLVKSLKDMINAFQKSSKVFYSADISDISGLIPKRKEIFIFRMLQECITNVEKHANATACNLSVKETKEQIVFRFKDNGKGFNVKQQKESNLGLGMNTLKERAQFIGAELTINSIEGKGTIITIKTKKNES